MLCKRFAMLLLHLVKVTDTVLYVKEQERKGMRKHLSKVFTVVPQKKYLQAFHIVDTRKRIKLRFRYKTLTLGF